MRKVGAIIGALGLLAITAPPTAAGLYNTAEPISMPNRDFRKFQDTLISLRQSAIPITLPDGKVVRTPLHRRYEMIATLSARGLPKLTVEQRLDLSACLIRLQKFRDAANVLSPAQFEERDNFLVLSNLATAEQLDGQLRRAQDYLSSALELWPREWNGLTSARREWLKSIGWNDQEFLWFREVETYQLKLLRLRSKESLMPSNPLPENVDGLFDRGDKGSQLQFVGASGKYEAGKLAPAEQAKLPEKAIEIVEQLLIWMPFDMRLSWLLGELYNAEGNVPAAYAIFTDVAAKWDPRAGSQTGFVRDAALPKLFKEHLAVLKQQIDSQPRILELPAPSPRSNASVDTQQANAGPPVDWKSLGVGFGGGIVVAFLASWQLREIRRRRASGAIH